MLQFPQLPIQALIQGQTLSPQYAQQWPSAQPTNSADYADKAEHTTASTHCIAQCSTFSIHMPVYRVHTQLADSGGVHARQSVLSNPELNTFSIAHPPSQSLTLSLCAAQAPYEYCHHVRQLQCAAPPISKQVTPHHATHINKTC